MKFVKNNKILEDSNAEVSAEKQGGHSVLGAYLGVSAPLR
jgi:hypothetical protein